MAKQVSTAAAPTMTVIKTATITASQAGGSDTRRLGTGAEIGLGVGLTTLVLIVLVSITAFLFLRKRRTLDNGPELAGGAYNGPIELGTTSQPKAGAKEIDSKPLSELG